MNLKQKCTALARSFRLGHHVESTLVLPELLEKVLADMPVNSHIQVARIIAAMLACQEHHDWLGLADWLEGELMSLLEAEG